MPMPSDFSVLLAFVLTVLWAAISLPLQYFNPLKFSDDEKTTRVLVYVVAPFIFFSVIFFSVILIKGRRQQERKQLEERMDGVYTKANELYKAGVKELLPLYYKGELAFRKGDYETARNDFERIEYVYKR
jgi:hypothetical protein